MGVKLYCITCRTNGKMYVGITKQSLAQRWRVHVSSALRGDRPHHRMSCAIRKYGRDDFDMIELFDYGSDVLAIAAEKELIAQLELVTLGYNMSPGGEPRFYQSETSRAAHIKSLTGRVRSAAERAAISAGRKGIVFSDDHRAKLSAAKLGKTRRPHTEETKRKMSEAAKNRSRMANV